MTLSPAIAITILNIGISFWAVTFCLCSDSRRYASISIRSPEIQYPRAAEDDNIALFCGSSLKFARFISNRIVLSGNPVILCRSARDIASSRPSGIKSSMFIASPIKTEDHHREEPLRILFFQRPGPCEVHRVSHLALVPQNGRCLPRSQKALRLLPWLSVQVRVWIEPCTATN